MKRFMVISGDSHAGAPNAVYRDYLDPEFRGAFDAGLAEAARMRASAAITDTDEHDAFVEEWKEETGGDGGELASWDPLIRDKECDRDGVACEVIFPDADAANLGWKSGGGSAPFGSGLKSSGVSDPRLVMAGARAHNRWLADMCAVSPKRRIGIAVVPIVHDIDLALEEIRRAVDSGLKGVLIPTRWMDKPAYHDPIYDPVWSLCTDLNVPITTHSGAGPADYGLGPGMTSIYAIESWWWAARPLWVLILGGIFDRHPNLKYAMTENGAWFVPDLMAKMDEKWVGAHATRKMGTSVFREGLSQKPSEYMNSNCWMTASVMGSWEIERRHQIGVGNLLWGSDFPHPEGSWPHTREWIRKSFRSVPEEETERLLGLNAFDVYDLDREAIRTVADEIGPTYEEIYG